MVTRGHIGARARTDDASQDDDLTRLVRMIARHAAQEAFNLFKEDLVAPAPQTTPPSELPTVPEQDEGTAGRGQRSPGPGERFLSVAEVALRLDVSQKTVRRKIASGELRAHRVGKLLRVGERGLSACLGEARPGEDQKK
jgi:excisionase family DNA binding protein